MKYSSFSIERVTRELNEDNYQMNRAMGDMNDKRQFAREIIKEKKGIIDIRVENKFTLKKEECYVVLER